MSKIELPKAYEAGQYEDALYKRWEELGLFKPWNEYNGIKPYPKKKPFVVMMPPPNATGTLHIGHAMFLTLEDIMVRYHRMKGEPTLWLPGTDHAAVATQAKVEKIIRKEEGKTRHDIGKEELLKRIHAFIAKSQDTIRMQVRKMGSSCDWSRERYTLEPNMTHAVRKMFVDMYNDGLIYRGLKMINWDPVSETTLSNEEVITKEVQGHLYHFRYPLKDSKDHITVATTRPETMLGDTAVAVNPKDKRYKKLVGRTVVLPLMNKEIPIIADDYVDPTFGTGAVKITPAHDPNDFAIGQRHKLETVTILDNEGHVNQNGGAYRGLDRKVVRKKIVEDMKALGLLEKIEDRLQSIGFSERSDAIIEPMVSLQWFVATTKPFRKGKSLQKMCQDVIRKEKITIIPKRFEKQYFNWVDNFQDWCISRQIWFGHQIPAWHCQECGDIVVSVDTPTHCANGHSKLKQDEDNLDTWFSSGLWTFSTLGWPASVKTTAGKPSKSKDLEYFHPTSVLETGYDILTFWVIRMIMMSMYALDEVPFRYIYLHGLVRDESGNKMSKSLGNIIDPLDMIPKYGTDAIRLSLSLGTTPGNDTRMSENKIASFRNFVNKIWNISRYILGSIDYVKAEKLELKSISDRYIVSELQRVIAEVTKHLDTFQFSEAGTMLYDFMWHDFADWYIEISKVEDRKNHSVLLYVLTTLLKLLHPFTPFVTEQIWSFMYPEKHLIIESWPKANKKLIDPEAEKKFTFVKGLITQIRTKRAELKIDPVRKIGATIISKKHFNVLELKVGIIGFLARLSPINISKEKKMVSGPHISIIHEDAEVVLSLEGVINIEEEKTKTMLAISNIEKQIHSLQQKLSNKNFTEKAPPTIVAEERKKLTDLSEQKILLEEKLSLFTAF